jgi:predicted Zn-dependent protease
MSRFVVGLSTLAALFLTGAGLRGDDKEDAKKDEAVSAADQKLFTKVMDRLLHSDLAIKEYPKQFAFPPRAFVKPHSADEVNAYASASPFWGAVLGEEGEKSRPVVMVTQGMLKEIVKGDENSLAVIMGHELAHLSKGHVMGRKGETPLTFLAFGREQEIEADFSGLRYAMAAGYPYRVGVAKALKAMQASTRATSFEGLQSTHPTWEERLALLDREQAKLWTCMSAFQNGYFFLLLEQYPAAQQCFRAVVAEFPDCHEAWANLGYTLLMQYCDALDTDDLRQLDVGQTVVGGFYRRPASLQAKVRGADEKKWREAVKALHKALELKKDLALPRLNLGVAYLFHPEGKNVKQAAHWFDQAEKHVPKDPAAGENFASWIALQVNGGVVDLARGNTKAAAGRFAQAAEFARALDNLPMMRSVQDALLYNQALLHARSTDKDEQREGCKLFEQYLAHAPAESAWWPLAYEKYAKLAGQLGEAAKPASDLAGKSGSAPLRLVTSIQVGAEPVTLSDRMEQAVAKLDKKKGVAIPLYPGSRLVRWRFTEQGIDLLGGDRIAAIFLTSPAAPPVAVQASGSATRRKELRVGMTDSDAREVLRGQRVEPKSYVADGEVLYRSYPELGLALRYEDQRIKEIAIAQVPRIPQLGK